MCQARLGGRLIVRFQEPKWLLPAPAVLGLSWPSGEQLVQTDDHPPVTRLVLTCFSELNTWVSISCCVFSHWSLVFHVFDEVAKSLKLRTIPSIQGSAAHLLDLPGMELTDGDDGVAPGPES